MVSHKFDKLTSAEIQRILPHRYPFLLVDRIEEVSRGEKSPVGDCIVGYKAVTRNEHFFDGHFPGNPVMPGVLILEALAQTAALLTFQHMAGGGQDYNIYLSGIEKTKFRHPVTPGAMLRLEAEIKKVSMKKLWVVTCQAFVTHGSNKILAVESQMSSVVVQKAKEK